MSVEGSWKFTLLKALKTSQRISKFVPSVIFTFLFRLKSSEKLGGPVIGVWFSEPICPAVGNRKSPEIALGSWQAPPSCTDRHGSNQKIPPLRSLRPVKFWIWPLVRD